MDDIVIVLDKAYRVLDMNKKARQYILTEHSSISNYIGVSLETLASDWQGLIEAVWDTSLNYARLSYSKGMETAYFDMRKTEIHNKKGASIGQIVDMRDITSLEEALQAAQKAKAAAETANKYKGFFLANVSHEIRTPINAVIGIAEMLESGDFTKEEQQRYIKTMIHSAESLVAIINDILDLSKVEAGRLELERHAFDLQDLLEGATDIFRISKAGKLLEITTEIDAKLPRMLMGDSGRIRQILINLIGNAMKFTEKGGINVSAKLLEQKDERITVELTVADTGLGIPEDKLDSIFESFKQADSSTTRKYGGTGLGLSIVKRLTALMQGSVQVESKLGEGSAFTVRLTLETAAEQPQELVVKQEEQIEFSRLQVLVADDNKINREIIAMNLKKLQCQFEVVENGRQAFEKYKNNCYDVILMDVQMPEMDGLEATNAIRQHEKDTGKHAKIIALTASAMKEDIDSCMEAGMDAHLSKPIKLEKLRETINRIL